MYPPFGVCSGNFDLDLFITAISTAPTQTAAYLDLDTFGTHTERRNDRHHLDKLFYRYGSRLTGNGIANDHGIEARGDEDVDLNIIFTSQLLQQLFLEITVYTAFTYDDDAWQGVWIVTISLFSCARSRSW